MPYMMDTVCTCLYDVNILCNFELPTAGNFHCIILAVIISVTYAEEREKGSEQDSNPDLDSLLSDSFL